MMSGKNNRTPNVTELEKEFYEKMEKNKSGNSGHFRGYILDSLARFTQNKAAMTCAFVIALFILVAIFAPFLAPYDPNAIDLKSILKNPTAAHPFGTDELGRDILSRVIYGARVSIVVGLVTTSISTLLGIVLGAVAGYRGGLTDIVISRLMEIFSAFPDILFAVGVMFILGPGVINLFIALGILGWVGTARLIRGQVMQLKEKEYIEAARASGASGFWLIIKHLIPNCVSTIIILVTMGIPGAMMSEAALSFLGLGVQPPNPSWGSMINMSRTYIRTLPTYSIFPGVAMIIVVLAFNIFGDGLRDALDPRLKI
jgi:peptide/nickel transport system permease protein